MTRFWYLTAYTYAFMTGVSTLVCPLPRLRVVFLLMFGLAGWLIGHAHAKDGK